MRYLCVVRCVYVLYRVISWSYYHRSGCIVVLGWQGLGAPVDFDMQAEEVDLTWHLLGDVGVQKLVKKLPRSRCKHLILGKNEVG